MSRSDRAAFPSLGELLKDDESRDHRGKSPVLIGAMLGEFPPARSKYHREIKPGVFVDVYDVMKAWNVTNPALQHLLKKALQPGERGHKTLIQDMDDIVQSAVRARELAE